MMGLFVCTEDYPVVQTKAGAVRGYEYNGSFIFKGIKYADAKRLMAPVEVAPWEGTKDVQSYGMVCPLMDQEHPNGSGEMMVPHMYWPMDENCQYLNIWTPVIDAQAKKPVMVWLHGGGFEAGSAIEQLAYDGENMCKEGDVVVVSVNHRLNILGYLDLSPFDEKYEASANAGNHDLIAALRWIQQNIAGFGGDPDNVTIFGQSGGGAKVWTLMQMPEADGLFHKGIIQSGVFDLLHDVEDGDGRLVVTAMLKELGLAETEYQKLETLPYEQLAAAYKKVAPAIEAAGGYVGNHPHMNKAYLGDPRKHGFTEHAKQLPLLVGTVLGEFDFCPPMTGKRSLSQEKLEELVKERFGEAGIKLLPLFKEAYPEKALIDLLAVDTIFRPATIDFIKERGKAHQSRTYSYQFTYEFPLYDGKVAWHCSEIPFVFHNIDKVPVCNGEDAEKLQANMFGAWIAFARTGAPQVPGVDWPACTQDGEATMLFDRACRVKYNVDHELIAGMQKLAHPMERVQGDVQH